MSLKLGVHSLDVQRTINTNERAMADANRRLASGKRVERASDDAAGSQIAETFTSQVRGYARAARNAYGGMNLAKQADHALGEINNVLIGIKTLAIQAASDTLSDKERATLQVGAQQFIDEVEAIGSRTDFSGTQLLDGSFMQKALHIGMGYKEAADITIKDARATYLGRYAIQHTEEVNDEALQTGDIFINDVRVRATVAVDDRISTTLSSTSAISKVAAINDASSHSNVAALVNHTELAAVADIAGGDLDSSNALLINGVVIGTKGIERDDGSELLQDAINRLSKETGVIASLNEQGRLVLTAEDGRNIDVNMTGSAHEITGLDNAAGSIVKRAGITLFSDDIFTVHDRAGLGREVIIGSDINEIVGANRTDVVSTIDISSRRGANRAMLIVDRAMEAVLQSRAQMGGMENRLEFTVSRLNEASKNAYHARSKIVDADVITESAQLVRGQILRQAFTTVLAQANNTPGQVLQLL